MPQKKTGALPSVSIEELDKKFLLKNDWPHFAYASLLLELPPGDVKEFFDRLPMTLDGRKLSRPELLAHLWNDDEKTPFTYVLRMLNALEPFLSSRGIQLTPFLDKYFKDLGHGVVHTPRFSIWLFSFFFQSVYRNRDPRYLLLKHTPAINRRCRPGTEHLLLKITEDEGEKKGYLAYLAPVYPPYRDAVPPIECLLMAKTMQMCPMRLGGSPYDGYEFLAERLPVCDIVGQRAAIAVQGGDLKIDGVRHGKVVRFHDFLDSLGVRIDGKFRVADAECILVTRDFYCSERGRVVLHKGCVYGAPIYLYTVFWKTVPAQTGDLSALLAENLDLSKTLWLEAGRRHLDLLAKLKSEKIRLHYDAANDVFMIDEVPITREANARILRKMLSEYVLRKRTVFARKEFLYDPTITADRNNPNLEIRLQRITEELARKCPRIGIAKSGRGHYLLRVDCTPEFTESRVRSTQ